MNQSELINVCKLVGLSKVASSTIADEVYEKLQLMPECKISFKDFIALIQLDSELLPSDFYSINSNSNNNNNESSNVVIENNTDLNDNAKNPNITDDEDEEDCCDESKEIDMHEMLMSKAG